MKNIFWGKLLPTHQGRCWRLRPRKWRQELGFPASGSSTRRGECCQVWGRSCLRSCCSDKVEEKWITCEVVHPAAEVPSPPSTGWMKTAGRVVANRATICAPVKCPRGQCSERSSFSVAFFFFFGQQKTWPAILRVVRAVATRAE